MLNGSERIDTDQSLAVTRMNVVDLQSEFHQASLIKEGKQHENCEDARLFN